MEFFLARAGGVGSAESNPMKQIKCDFCNSKLTISRSEKNSLNQWNGWGGRNYNFDLCQREKCHKEASEIIKSRNKKRQPRRVTFNSIFKAYQIQRGSQVNNYDKKSNTKKA